MVLASFSGRSSVDVKLTSSGSLALSGSWDASKEHLYIDAVDGEFSAGKTFDATISGLNDIRLPSAGLARNDVRLMMSALVPVEPEQDTGSDDAHTNETATGGQTTNYTDAQGVEANETQRSDIEPRGTRRLDQQGSSSEGNGTQIYDHVVNFAETNSTNGTAAEGADTEDMDPDTDTDIGIDTPAYSIQGFVPVTSSPHVPPMPPILVTVAPGKVSSTSAHDGVSRISFPAGCFDTAQLVSVGLMALDTAETPLPTADTQVASAVLRINITSRSVPRSAVGIEIGVSRAALNALFRQQPERRSEVEDALADHAGTDHDARTRNLLRAHQEVSDQADHVMTIDTDDAHSTRRQASNPRRTFQQFWFDSSNGGRWLPLESAFNMQRMVVVSNVSPSVFALSGFSGRFVNLIVPYVPPAATTSLLAPATTPPPATPAATAGTAPASTEMATGPDMARANGTTNSTNTTPAPASSSKQDPAGDMNVALVASLATVLPLCCCGVCVFYVCFRRAKRRAKIASISKNPKTPASFALARKDIEHSAGKSVRHAAARAVHTYVHATTEWISWRFRR